MYSEEQRQNVLNQITEDLMDGKSLREICAADKGLPNRATILRWANEDSDFAATIARARDMQADALDDDIQEVVNQIRSGALKPEAGRVVIWALQWRASKMKPRTYGERIQKDVKVNTDLAAKLDAAAKRLARMKAEDS